jgi:hypothetical protein
VVDPADPPIKNKKKIMVLEKEGHISKSSVAYPVDDKSDIIVKAECLTVSRLKPYNLIDIFTAIIIVRVRAVPR